MFFLTEVYATHMTTIQKVQKEGHFAFGVRGETEGNLNKHE